MSTTQARKPSLASTASSHNCGAPIAKTPLRVSRPATGNLRIIFRAWQRAWIHRLANRDLSSPFGNLTDRYDDPPRFYRMFDQFMRVCYLIQGDNLGNVESLPSCLKCLIETVSGFHLCLRRNIVAVDKEDSCVYKHKLPERNLRRRSIGGVMEPPCASSVLTFLHISRIDARKGNANPNFTCAGVRIT